MLSKSSILVVVHLFTCNTLGATGGITCKLRVSTGKYFEFRGFIATKIVNVFKYPLNIKRRNQEIFKTTDKTRIMVH